MAILTALSVPVVHGLTTEDHLISSTAMIEHLDVTFTETLPRQIQVVIHGYLPDSCTQVDTVTTKVIQQTFYVTVATVRPGQLECAQMLVSFKEVVTLETNSLAAGNYTINVNGVTGTFTLKTEEQVQ